MPRLIAATNNPHKLEEIRTILQNNALDIVPPDSISTIPEIEEDKATFKGNATKKAGAIAEIMEGYALADDSGLEVDALDGAPGVRTARYAGEKASDAANIEKLLRNLRDNNDRTARFVCVIALASSEGLLGTARGTIEGTIATAPRGNNGFGYDPVFIPEGYTATFAEFSEAAKNKMSHRARALENGLQQGLFQILG